MENRVDKAAAFNKEVGPTSEWLKRFLRHYRKADQALSGFQGTKFRATFKEGKGKFESELPKEEIVIRIAVVMRRFLNPNSSLYYKRVWVRFRSTFGNVIQPAELTQIDALMRSARGGDPKIVLGTETYTAERIYRLISAGDLFGDDDKAAAELQRIAQQPILQHLFWHQFLSYTIAIFEILSMIESIVRRERLHCGPIYSANVLRCIYCLSSQGTFNSEEHILSESAGNEQLILPAGVVCDRCNNTILAELDQCFCESSLIAPFRVLYVPITKQGRLPKATLQNAQIESRRPGVIHIHAKDKTAEPRNVRHDDNGMIRLTTSFTGRLDRVKFGRSLYKIGLGLVAYDQGVARALASCFNAARSFIRGDSPCPNRVLMATTCVPEPRVHCLHQSFSAGTVVVLVYCGLPFVLNLESEPVMELSGIPIELADQFRFNYLLDNSGMPQGRS